MKRVMFCAIMIMGGLALRAQTGKVVIEGTLSGDLKGHEMMYMYTRMGEDSSVIENGHYRFEFPFKEVVMKMLLPQYIIKEGQVYRPFGILIDRPGTYYVRSNIAKGMFASELKGPEGMLLYANYERDQDSAYLSINKVLAERLGKEWWQIEENDPRYADRKALEDSLHEAFIVPLLEKLIRKHPDAVATAFTLSANGRSLASVDQQLALYNMLSDRMKQSTEGVKFYHFIQGEKNSVIGHTVPDFSLPDPQDNSLSFDRFKGKYVMVDFWASWCVPCRHSFPTMRKLYQQYKDKGFEIYSISIDEKKDAWEKAVQEEQNPWTQALDDKDISHSLFAVNAVPTTYLIDPDGKIIAKQVGFDDNTKGPVEEKLASLYGPLAAAGSAGSAAPGAAPKKVIKAASMVPMH